MSLLYPLISKCQRIKLGESDEQEHKSQASQRGLECACDGPYEWNCNSKAVSEQHPVPIPYSTESQNQKVRHHLLQSIIWPSCHSYLQASQRVSVWNHFLFLLCFKSIVKRNNYSLIYLQLYIFQTLETK